MFSLVNVPGLVLGLLLSAPGLYEAFESPAVDITAVLLRFVVITVVMSLGYGVVRELVYAYARGANRGRAQAAMAAAEHSRRRAGDSGDD